MLDQGVMILILLFFFLNNVVWIICVVQIIRAFKARGHTNYGDQHTTDELSQEEEVALKVAQFKKRLHMNRRTLDRCLLKLAELGPLAPSGVFIQIEDTRRQIRINKVALRALGVDVPDHPDDEESPVS